MKLSIFIELWNLPSNFIALWKCDTFSMTGRHINAVFCQLMLAVAAAVLWDLFGLCVLCRLYLLAFHDNGPRLLEPVNHLALASLQESHHRPFWHRLGFCSVSICSSKSDLLSLPPLVFWLYLHSPSPSPGSTIRWVVSIVMTNYPYLICFRQF